MFCVSLALSFCTDGWNKREFAIAAISSKKCWDVNTVYLLNVISFLYWISGKKESEEIKITVCRDKRLMSCGRRRGQSVQAGHAVINERVCACVSTRFGRVTWIYLEVMHLFVTGHPHCHAPFFACWSDQYISCPLSRESRPTFLQNLLQVCESILKLCHLLY